MTLATRCTACGTSFRVVQDQLKVSGGWVRCGRCNEIFNAIEGLYEVGSPMAEPPPSGATVEPPPDRESTLAPASASAPAPARAAPPAAVQQPAAAPAPVATPEAASSPAEDFRVDSEDTPADSAADTLPDARQDRAAAPMGHLPPAEPGPAAPDVASEPSPRAARHEPLPAAPDPAARAPARGVAEDDAPDWPDHGGETLVPDLDATSTPAGVESVLLVPSPADQWRAEDSPAAAPMPSFLRKAERAARWRRPHVRLTLALAGLALLVLLGAQAGIAYRDLVAARWPALRAPMEQACALLGCTVEPPRHIAALSVESSSLLQVGTDAVYALQVSVRNRSDLALLPPALELVLTDTQGRTVARRVLTLAEMGQSLRTLPPGAEVSAQATLATGPQRVAGYTIEIFYP